MATYKPYKKTNSGKEEVKFPAGSIEGLAPVATSGEYSDLSGKPTNCVTTDTTQTITGAKTFAAPANVAGTEQATVWFKTANGGRVGLGKQGANSGTAIFFDQVEGTRRLNFRASSAAGAIVWDQPESDSCLYFDVDKVHFRNCGNLYMSGSGLYPVTNNTKSVGTSSNKFSQAHITTIYEGGTSLVDKYANKSHTHSAASTSDAGFMSATDKTNLDTLVSLLKDDDANTTVDTIKEVLNVFEAYPEGTTIINALAEKSNTGHTHDYSAVFAAKSHSHTFTSLTSKPTTLSGYGITDAAASGHTHSYLPLSGGTIDGYLIINGSAADRHLVTRGIGGSTGSGNTPSDLYINYGQNYGLRFGKTGNGYLKSDGGANFAVRPTVGSESFAYVSELPTIPTNYVTTDTAQTVSGAKTFTGVSSFNQEVKFTSSSYAPTWSDIANGIGKSSCFTRGAFMQLISGQILLPNNAYSDSSRGYNTEVNKLKIQTMTTNNGQPVVTDVATFSSSGLNVVGSISEGGTSLSSKYASKNDVIVSATLTEV